MDPNLKLHQLIEKEVKDIEFGVITVNVILVEGKPKIETLNIVKSKRYKYPQRKG